MKNFSQLNFPRSDFYGFGESERTGFFTSNKCFYSFLIPESGRTVYEDMKYLYDSYDLYLLSRFMKGKM